ncbi:MAG: hypothetical protein FJ096_18025 [Deltaproteobacteria bacterium]|nr:hypothetical protein [Deltaproteobacteria bacterium]
MTMPAPVVAGAGAGALEPGLRECGGAPHWVHFPAASTATQVTPAGAGPTGDGGVTAGGGAHAGEAGGIESAGRGATACPTGGGVGITDGGAEGCGITGGGAEGCGVTGGGTAGGITVGAGGGDVGIGYAAGCCAVAVEAHASSPSTTGAHSPSIRPFTWLSPSFVRSLTDQARA